ncbi:unnamed protein product [Arctia plantaginis]|uniref:Uncharacterized protein n=1 Tax=Arctia plantaginis TaxID=874455 RepID=A0A8S1BMG7_ARCPL|nr:unnamed protein product [Arctia plantaginis]
MFGTIPHKTRHVKVMGVPIERVFEVRNLELIMDADLRFEKHISNAVRDCFYKLKVKLLVESLVFKSNYADTVYGPRLLSRTEGLIQRLQNACARLCFTVP